MPCPGEKCLTLLTNKIGKINEAVRTQKTSKTREARYWYITGHSASNHRFICYLSALHTIQLREAFFFSIFVYLNTYNLWLVFYIRQSVSSHIIIAVLVVYIYPSKRKVSTKSELSKRKVTHMATS